MRTFPGAKFKITHKDQKFPWYAWKIEAKKNGYFPPFFMVYYQTEGDHNVETTHIVASQLTEVKIECLSEEALFELSDAKKKYEHFKKR